MNKEEEIIVFIQEFDQLQKRMDSIYNKLAKSSGLSDIAFWIIYTIKNEKETYKQKDLCNMWFYSKQTINSALKKLENQNIIQLISVPENRKNKKVILTAQGKKLAKELIEPVIEIEKKSLKNIKERMEFLNLFKRYVEMMEEEADNFIEETRRKNENNF